MIRVRGLSASPNAWRLPSPGCHLRCHPTSPLRGEVKRFVECLCLERQRLDKWLWHARVVRARSSAAALIEAGHVRINGVREKAPGHAVKAGDVLTIGLDRTVRILKVVGFAE